MITFWKDYSFKLPVTMAEERLGMDLRALLDLDPEFTDAVRVVVLCEGVVGVSLGVAVDWGGESESTVMSWGLDCSPERLVIKEEWLDMGWRP